MSGGPQLESRELCLCLSLTVISLNVSQPQFPCLYGADNNHCSHGVLLTTKWDHSGKELSTGILGRIVTQKMFVVWIWMVLNTGIYWINKKEALEQVSMLLQMYGSSIGSWLILLPFTSVYHLNDKIISPCQMHKHAGTGYLDILRIESMYQWFSYPV